MGIKRQQHIFIPYLTILLNIISKLLILATVLNWTMRSCSFHPSTFYCYFSSIVEMSMYCVPFTVNVFPNGIFYMLYYAKEPITHYTHTHTHTHTYFIFQFFPPLVPVLIAHFSMCTASGKSSRTQSGSRSLGWCERKPVLICGQQTCTSHSVFLTDGLLERTMETKNRPAMAY